MSDSGRTDVPENANTECVGSQSDLAGKAASCAGCPNQKLCASGETKKADPAKELAKARMSGIKHKLLVLSGKGGVGKSSFACQLAFSLAAKGKQVGLLDIDICGPSVPRMLGLTGQEVHKSASGWSPVYLDDNLGVMSIGFMLPDQDAAVIWRGPKKNGLIKQFLTDVDWGELDYLIIDTPPGTSDEHISIAQYLGAQEGDGAVVVTTPQEVAMMDVRKELSFCQKVKLPVLGVVENMSGLQVPLREMRFADAAGVDTTEAALAALAQKCPEVLQMMARTEVFPSFGAGPEGMAAAFGVPFLGRLPLDPKLLQACEEGEAYLEKFPDGPAAPALAALVQAIQDSAAKAKANGNQSEEDATMTD